MLTNKIIRMFRSIVTLSLLVTGVVFIYMNRSELAVLTQLSLSELSLLTLCVFGFFVITGYTFKVLVSMLSVEMLTVEWIGLTFLTTFVNYLGPLRPGIVVKAAYLKQQKNMSYARYSSILAANGFLLFLYSGITGLILLFLTWLTKGIVSYLLIVVCIGLIGGALIPFVVHLSRIERQGRFWNTTNNAIEGFAEIRAERGKIIKVGLTVIGQYFVSALCSLVAYRALGYELDLLTALLLGVFASISNFFTITPNNIGIQETVMAYLYSVSGLDFVGGLLGASLVRAVHIILTFGLTPLFTYLMLRSTKQSLSVVLPNVKG